MTRQQSVARRFNVLAARTRILKAPSHSKDDAPVEVTLHENSRLLIKHPAANVRLRYAGKPNGQAHIHLDEGATGWIASWHSRVSGTRVHIEVASHACVGISEEALASASAPHSEFSITFNANGTGCLTAAWAATQSPPPLQIAGMSPGDRLGLAIRDLGGALRSFNGTCTSSMAGAQGAVIALSVKGLETAHLDWNMPTHGEIESLPSGLCAAMDDTRVDSAAPLFPVDHAPFAHAPASTSSTVKLRACIEPVTWARLAPVVFEADALAPGIPLRRVALAPGQPVRHGDQILLANQLVNGQSIRQGTDSHQICYFRPPEMELSDIPWAGLDLIADPATPCAPHYAVEQCRQRLLQYTASRFRIGLSPDPALRLELGRQSVGLAAYEPGIWRATVPASISTSPLCIVSRSACARDTTLFPLEDSRILGVALADIVIHSAAGSRHLDLSHPAWTGLHEPEFRRGRARRWTNGLASLPGEVHQLHGGETIELHIAAVGRYWVDAALDELGQAA